jgi:glycosyltransferase involved in cell wall biosynthesis
MENKITVVIPAFNEEVAISRVLDQLGRSIYSPSIIVVDDGSTDNTKYIAQEKEFVHVISHKHNKGYGASIKTGILACDTEYVALFDGDGQHRVEEFEKLYKNISDNHMIVGNRGLARQTKLNRKPGKMILGWFVNLLSNRKIPDFNSGLRIFHTETIRKYLHLMPDGFSFSTTSTVALNSMGYNVEYVTIKVANRVGRSSNVKIFRDGFKTIMLILNLTMLFNPFKIFFPVSIGLFVVSFMSFLFSGVTGSFDLTDGMVLGFVTGILVFFMGLLAEQIAAMRRQLNLIK